MWHDHTWDQQWFKWATNGNAPTICMILSLVHGGGRVWNRYIEKQIIAQTARLYKPIIGGGNQWAKHDLTLSYKLYILSIYYLLAQKGQELPIPNTVHYISLLKWQFFLKEKPKLKVLVMGTGEWKGMRKKLCYWQELNPGFCN